ncbi:MAG: HNH endonuclease [Limnochordia bacterium]|jgi:hypothetical protein
MRGLPGDSEGGENPKVEHLTPVARGGSNRVSNLGLACEPCNREKGTMTAEDFGFPDLQKQASQSLRDAAGVNATERRDVRSRRHDAQRLSASLFSIGRVPAGERCGYSHITST